MNKKIICSAILIGLLGIASLVSAEAVTITNPLSATSFKGLLCQIASGVGELIAVLGTIMLIVAGILYLTSAGSPEKITKAKTAFIYAIAGIAIGVAASAIVNVVMEVVGTNGVRTCP